MTQQKMKTFVLKQLRIRIKPNTTAYFSKGLHTRRPIVQLIKQV